MIKQCDHQGSIEQHAFRWPENLPAYHPKYASLYNPGRNIWNPLAPVCIKCGKNIAEILLEVKKLRYENERLRKMIGSPELLERLSDIEHDRWAGWMRYLFSKCEDGKTIPGQSVTHWRRQMGTPYSELSEKEKESDRKEARRTLEAIDDFLEANQP